MTTVAAQPERGMFARIGIGIQRHKMASFGVAIVVLVALSSIFAPWLSPHDPLEQDVLLRLATPSVDFPLGNDSFGRDILSRILWGGRVSLYVSTVAVFIAIVVGGALGNALIPVVTVVGLYLGVLIGNSVLTEIVFNRPGLGKLIVQSLNRRDYTMLEGLMVIYAFIIVIVNLLTDLTYGVVDPRVRQQ